MNKDKEFLLNESKVFCMAPWVHIHSGTRGDMRPCCIANCEKPIGVVGKDKYTDAFNSPEMKQLRVDMLNEQPNEICRRCNIFEDNGTRHGYKSMFNRSWAHRFDAVTDTNLDGSLDEVSLPYVDFRFSNKCNLKCVTCGTHASNAWYKDHNAMTGDNLIAMIKPDAEITEIYDELDELIPDLEQINFAGGEPLIMDEHYHILKRLISENKTDVTLHYNTNFMKTRYRGHDICELWKHFKKVYVGISLDGYGERGEYIRKGLNFDTLIGNITTLKKQVPHVKFHITTTLSVLNALHITDFHKYLIDRGIIKAFEFQIIMLTDPYHYNIMILSDEHKATFVAQINEHVAYLKTLEQTESAPRVIDSFEQTVNYVNGILDSKHRTLFKETIDKLDKLRNQCFKQTFPEIKDMI